MKILIVSQYFWPEEFRVNDLAIDLVERGYDVTVLTGNPNYPIGKFYSGYGFNKSKESYKNIKIHRVPIIARGSNVFTLILNYFSFVVSGSIFAFFHKEKYDKVFAINFSPITSVIPAIVYKKKYNVKLYLWVQDLWPESVSAGGKINSKFILYFLTKIVKYIYKNSDEILVQSKAFINSIVEKGVEKEKIHYLPNWAEDLYSIEVSGSKYEDILPKGFVVMFAGNIGESQDFESIVKAAKICSSEKDIKWVIIGDGRKMPWLKNEIAKLNLEETIFLLGRYPVKEMPVFFKMANIMLLSLKKEEIFSYTIPSKVQSYMATKKPIVGMLDGAGAKVIKDSDCGYFGAAADYKKLSENVLKAYKEKPTTLADKGLNGWGFYQKNFSKKKVVDFLLKIFNKD